MHDGKRVGIMMGEWPRGTVKDGSDHKALRVQVDDGGEVVVSWKDVCLLSECCDAWPKGTDDGVVCRACYADICI